MQTVSKPTTEDAYAAVASHPERRAQPKLPWRAFLLGALLIPGNSLWIARTEGLDSSGWPTCLSLFYNVIFDLMALLLVNALVRRIRPRQALTQTEMIVVYAMLVTSSSLAGRDCLQILVATIPHVRYFATPENGWATLILPHLPPWLTITTYSDALKQYENGHSTLYTWDHLRIWLLPVASWSVFLLANMACTLSICVILRRQWVENERLAYPIVQIPLLITENGGASALFRNRLLWFGIAVSAGINLLDGLAQLYPSLPSIKVTYVAIYPIERPWNATGPMITSFYPCIIGLSYFMPTKMAFSSVFFFFVRKAEQVVAGMLGYISEGNTWDPYLREQGYGAWFTLFLASLWLGRGYLKEVWRAAWSQQGQMQDGGLSYRGAFIVLVLGMVVMAVVLIAAGMSPVLACVYVPLLLILYGSVTRMRAELGPPVHELFYMGATNLLMVCLGTADLGPRNLTLFSLLWFQNRCHRGLLMAQQAESLKAANEIGLRLRTMVITLGLAGVIGLLAGFWAHLHLAYARPYAALEHPAAPGSGVSAVLFTQLASWLHSPLKPSQAGMLAIGVGVAITLILARLNVLFANFPLHPAGYALGLVAMDYIWIPVLFSWMLKVFILRYYGLRGYRAAMPFFVGLVLGEFAMGGFWSFLRGLLGVQTYSFFN